jgi:hypothetical protein
LRRGHSHLSLRRRIRRISSDFGHSIRGGRWQPDGEHRARASQRSVYRELEAGQYLLGPPNIIRGVSRPSRTRLALA